MNILNKEQLIKALLFPVTIVLLVVLSPFVLIWALSRLIKGLYLNIRFRSRWGKEGRHILFIYSESPNWQEYIEEHIIPKIKQRAVILNWSKRAEWKKKKPLEAKVLEHWGGATEFNPLAVVFMPGGKVKRIRFYKAFKDYKHGKDRLLKEKEAELFEGM